MKPEIKGVFAIVALLALMLGWLAFGALLAKTLFDYHGVQRWEQHTSCLTIDPEARPPEKIWVNL